MLSPIETYLRQIESALRLGDSTEHTHRPFLKTLVESLAGGITATNEPKRRHGNAPDYVVLKARVPVGYIEAKDIGISLAAAAKSEQLKRYLKSLNNLILTNYLEFAWYENGELRNHVKLASATSDGVVMKCFDSDALLESIFRQFFDSEVPTVTTAEDLAERMASRARELEKSVEKVLANNASASLRGLMTEFQKDLLPDLDDNKFADLYTQTIAYGLFTASYYLRTGLSLPSAVFNREAAFANLPRSNPFLKRMFQQIAGFDLEDEPFVWAVDNIAALLNRADMGQIMTDFVRGKGKDDPVIHFYETFLRAYDPKLRELRGVYYTPTPVVSYIVRSVDAILKRDFGLKDGLADASRIGSDSATHFGSDSGSPPYKGGVAAASADGVVLSSVAGNISDPRQRTTPSAKRGHPSFSKEGSQTAAPHRVLILDPATGTGTFLAKVIDVIYERYKREPQIWKGYVRDHLLPRLFGFEFLVAPYSIAHLKLGLRLADTGFEFGPDERLNIFLTNTLEEVQRLGETDAGGMGYWIHEEATKAQNVKKDAPVMVILGNPPYSGHSANDGQWMRDLLRGIETKGDVRTKTENYFEVDGAPLGERNPKWLNNDYVKFIRFSQWRIEQTGYGILAFITSNSYLDSPTFRGMRQSLMNTFDDIYILDLHGNSKKKEKALDGSKDENVFDITEGVSIGIFVKRPLRSVQLPPALAGGGQAINAPALAEPKESWAKAPESFSTDDLHLKVEAIDKNRKATEKDPAAPRRANVFHHSLLGLRETFQTTDGQKESVGGKYMYLRENDLTTTRWAELEPRAPFHLFIPQDTELKAEYGTGWGIANIMSESSLGTLTKRASLVIALTKEELWMKILAFTDPTKSDSDAIAEFDLPMRDKDMWDAKVARGSIDRDKINDFLRKEIYRPFDIRYILFHPRFIARLNPRIMGHFEQKNLGMCLGRQGSATNDPQWNLVTVSNQPIDQNAFRRGGTSVFPLYLYPTERTGLFDETGGEWRANISAEFIAAFSERLGLQWSEDSYKGGNPTGREGAQSDPKETSPVP